MFCSNCGQPLGAVAHYVNNQILCENCYLKLGQSVSNIPQHTVFLDHVSEDQRNAAANAIPPENVPVVPPQTTAQAQTASQQSVASALALPGEQVLWKRTFSKGIIHKEATLTEMFTSYRALCIDDQQNVIVRAAPLRGAAIAVTNTRRDYRSMHTGIEHYGAYMGTSQGSGVTIGDVQVLYQGRIIMTLNNIRDPFGLKRLIESSIKSQR